MRQDQIDTLKQELEDRKEEARRKDAILMTMAQRIPELEAPSETTGVAESAEGAFYGTSPQEVEDSLQRRSSWWRRFFGLE